MTGVLTPESFFSNYIKHPLSSELSTGEKIGATLSTIALTILTLGLIFLVPCCLSKRKIDKNFKGPTVHKTNDVANKSKLFADQVKQINNDIENVVISMKDKFQTISNISVASSKCVLKTNFSCHSQQSNFTLEIPTGSYLNGEDLLKKLEGIQKIHANECTKLPYGSAVKTEWAWMISDKDGKEYNFVGNLIPPHRGEIAKGLKSGTVQNFRV